MFLFFTIKQMLVENKTIKSLPINQFLKQFNNTNLNFVYRENLSEVLTRVHSSAWWMSIKFPDCLPLLPHCGSYKVRWVLLDLEFTVRAGKFIIAQFCVHALRALFYRSQNLSLIWNVVSMLSSLSILVIYNNTLLFF